MVFAVRKDITKVRVHYYLTQKIQKFAFKLFSFLVVFSFALFLLSSVLIKFGVPAVAVNLFLFIVSLPFIFLPQAIVVDETNILTSIRSSIEFMFGNLNSFLLVLITGTLFLLVLPAIEFVFDYFFLLGGFFSLVVSLIFIVPYLEAMKTFLFMQKYDLVKVATAQNQAKLRTV
jgi:hypothetical protein